MQTSPRGEGAGHNRPDNETGPVLPRADASKTEILSFAKANAHANLLSLSLSLSFISVDPITRYSILLA